MSICVKPCATAIFVLSCRAQHWQDGTYNFDCNNKECGYDGGDWIQLCPFEDIHTGYLELKDGECNVEYNKKECNYDILWLYY